MWFKRSPTIKRLKITNQRRNLTILIKSVPPRIRLSFNLRLLLRITSLLQGRELKILWFLTRNPISSLERHQNSQKNPNLPKFLFSLRQSQLDQIRSQLKNPKRKHLNQTSKQSKSHQANKRFLPQMKVPSNLIKKNLNIPSSQKIMVTWTTMLMI